MMNFWRPRLLFWPRRPVPVMSFYGWREYGGNYYQSQTEIALRTAQLWLLRCEVYQLTNERDRLRVVNQLQEKQLSKLRQDSAAGAAEEVLPMDSAAEVLPMDSAAEVLLMDSAGEVSDAEDGGEFVLC